MHCLSHLDYNSKKEKYDLGLGKDFLNHQKHNSQKEK